MEERDIMEALGLLEDEGVEEQELADPETVENEPDVSDAEEAEEDQGDNDEDDTDDDDNAGEAEKPKDQSSEENSKYAAARRKAEAERDAAISQAKEESQRELNEFIKGMGITNPYTQKPITNKAEYDEYQRRYEEEQKAQFMADHNMASDDEYKRFVESLPEVKRAREKDQQSEETIRRAREIIARAQMEESVREIGKIDPTIKSVKDLTEMETYSEFYKLVDSGLSFVEAYKLVNYEALISKAAAQGAQAARNSAQGKNHLNQTRGRGTTLSITVPDDIKAEYRALIPGVTDAEIQKHYERQMKNKK